MHAQWGKLCKKHEEPWYFSFFPTLGRVNVQNADFINLPSSAKWFHPTLVPAWIPQLLSEPQSRCSCSYSLCAQICLLRWGKEGRAREDGAINVSFKLKIVLPSALFQFPSVSFCNDASALKQSEKFFFFFFKHYFSFLTQLFLCSLLWHFCVFLYFCWLFTE